MSNAPAACCVSGVKHEGDPVGEIKDIGGRTLYGNPLKTNPQT